MAEVRKIARFRTRDGKTYYGVLRDESHLTVIDGSVFGDFLELRGTYVGGAPQMFATLNRGAEAGGALGNAIDVPDEWGEATRLSINSGGFSQISLGNYLAVKVHRGVRDLAFMRAL